MKILTVLESLSWADEHIAESLEAMGHEVTRYVFGSYVGEFYGRHRRYEQKAKNRDLVECAKRLRSDSGLDFIFCYVYDDFLLVDTAKALSKLDVPLVNFNVDMVNQWYRQIRTAKYFTYMLCAQKANMMEMARYGARTKYFPMAGRVVESNRTASDWIPAAPVTFVGTPMPYRNRVLNRLLAKEVSLAIYGKYWQEDRMAVPDRDWEKLIVDLRHYAWPKVRADGFGRTISNALSRFRNHKKRALKTTIDPKHLHGFIPGDSLEEHFKRSKINLGFTRMVGDHPNQPGINQVKLRDFEVPLSKGFYLVEHVDDYEDLFKIGEEVVTWHNVDDLHDKICYYLEHDDERLAIAERGYQRASIEHTWRVRFEFLFTELGLSS